MKIDADRIHRWAGQQAAPGELAETCRRLVHATTVLQSAAMPAGEAVNLPGWDGQQSWTMGPSLGAVGGRLLGMVVRDDHRA